MRGITKKQLEKLEKAVAKLERLHSDALEALNDAFGDLRAAGLEGRTVKAIVSALYDHDGTGAGHTVSEGLAVLGIAVGTLNDLGCEESLIQKKVDDFYGRRQTGPRSSRG